MTIEKKVGQMKVQGKKKKIWTHEGPVKKRKVGHMKVQEKKKR
jgi:hypothetical protein